MVKEPHLKKMIRISPSSQEFAEIKEPRSLNRFEDLARKEISSLQQECVESLTPSRTYPTDIAYGGSRRCMCGYHVIEKRGLKKPLHPNLHSYQ